LILSRKDGDSIRHGALSNGGYPAMCNSQGSYSLQKKPIGFSCTFSLPIQMQQARWHESNLSCCLAVQLACKQWQKTKTIGGRLVATATSRQFYGGEKWEPIPIFSASAKAPATRHAATLGRSHRRRNFWVWGGVGKRFGLGGGSRFSCHSSGKIKA
jgi:hypothetical protein